MRFNISKLAFLKLTGKKITVLFLILTIFFLLITAAAMLLNRDPGEQTRPEPVKTIVGQDSKPDYPTNQVLSSPSQNDTSAPDKSQGDCGNTICEPSLGETKENCPQDCSAQ